MRYNYGMAKLSDELIEKFVIEIEDGLPTHYTCDLLSISNGAYQSWMKQGESDFLNEIETINARFYLAVKKAYAKFIKESKRKIRNGEAGWQGTAWWLERTNKQFILNNDNADSIEPVIVNPGMSKKR
jgi:hypothetical protein